MMITRSLAFKWIATLLLTSLVGVVLVGLFAYRTTVTEFDRLRLEQVQASFVNEATTYYESTGSWNGFDDWLHQQQRSSNQGNQGNQGNPGNQGGGGGSPFQFCALVDSNNIVVVDAGPYHIGDRLPPETTDQGIAITLNGQQVGTVLTATPPPGPDPREQQYLDRTNQALLIGAIGAGAAALLIGLLLSRHFLRPLTELTEAIGAMKHGELSQQVQVRTHDELGELAQAFNQMSAEVHRANQLRTQMTADIAHDLRTPLTVITGYLEGLRDGTLKPTPTRFDVMYDETLLLKRLIDDLRTLSLADAGELKLVYQSIQPRDLLEQIQQSFEPLAQEQQIALKTEAEADLPDVQVDRERMAQVLANLVSNALRYTPAGGSVTLIARAQSNAVQLIVRDTGSGIPEDKLPNIFERFYRVEESRYQSQGESGLGLAIARSIVEAHHGTISAESKLGAGTSMIITLPAQPTSAKPSIPAEITATPI
ncbi:MAG TPA: ATP-binding protein [Phototrophicaceae bacterium]|nr:ATP-binding protein [Phototrophicaceae bacterium]